MLKFKTIKKYKMDYDVRGRDPTFKCSICG